MITGYPDGTFRPDNTVLLEEAVTVMLKLLGYTADDFGSSWPYGQLGIAANLHITDNISCTAGAELKRDDVLKLIYNTLVAQPKNVSSPQQKYLESLNCNLYENAVIIATNSENNSVTPGYVLTSEGSFKIDNSFDNDLVGRKGDLIVKNGVDYAAFMQSEQIAQKHVVYSMLADTVITFSNGAMTSFNVDDSILAYKDAVKTTFGSLKNSLSTGDIIYIMKNAGGNVDYINVTTDNMTGPYTVSNASQLSSYGINISGATIMRDGVKADIASVEANDIVYYLADINTVFVYSRKITGVYEKAYPNKDIPTSVTVSGVEYTIESAAAFDKLSSNGSFKFGDTITLLLGKDGQIADVYTTNASDELIVGYLTETGTKEFTNANGEAYSAIYAKIIKTDASVVEVVSDKNYSSYLNKIVSVIYDNGKAKLTKLRTENDSLGKVDAKNMKIGNIYVDSDVEILDVTTTESDEQGNYIRTYMQRLDGTKLSDSKILYVGKNSAGEISKLILNNATGDAYSYGMISDVTKTESGGSMKVTTRKYTCNIGGKSYVCNISYDSSFSLGSVVGVTFNGSAIGSMKKINSVGVVKKISDGYVLIDNASYTMSDNVVVYRSNLSSGIATYTTVPLSEIRGKEDDYRITAYMDKSVSEGGRVRVFVVSDKN